MYFPLDWQVTSSGAVILVSRRRMSLGAEHDGTTETTYTRIDAHTSISWFYFYRQHCRYMTVSRPSSPSLRCLVHILPQCSSSDHLPPSSQAVRSKELRRLSVAVDDVAARIAEFTIDGCAAVGQARVETILVACDVRC